jgi:ribonuclease BN (tRNA processing enzyme)
MDIRILGAHNAESSTTSCVSFIIDGTLAVEAGGLTSRLSIQEQQEIDAVILTHQHLDHIRDIPGIALTLFRHGASIDIWATSQVCENIKIHLLNKILYPEFQKIPEAKPTLNFKEIQPFGQQWIDGHNILAVPVNHGITAVGYQISDKQGKALFYTGDTGPELAECWQQISPRLLIIDVTVSNDCEEFAKNTGHLTPRLLEHELISFRECKGYLPEVLTVHMDNTFETKIKEEICAVGENLHISINMAYEGMQLQI